MERSLAPRKMHHKLTGLEWIRIGVSASLVGLSAFCVLRAVIAGIVFGDIVDLPGRSAQAVEIQRRGHRYLFLFLLLQGLTTLILAPVSHSLRGKLDTSRALGKPTDYALALTISVLFAGVAFLLLFWLSRSA